MAGKQTGLLTHIRTSSRSLIRTTKTWWRRKNNIYTHTSCANSVGHPLIQQQYQPMVSHRLTFLLLPAMSTNRRDGQQNPLMVKKASSDSLWADKTGWTPSAISIEREREIKACKSARRAISWDLHENILKNDANCHLLHAPFLFCVRAVCREKIQKQKNMSDSQHTGTTNIPSSPYIHC